MIYSLKMWDNCDGSNYTTIEAETIEEAIETAIEETEDWVREGEWGIAGASIRAYWKIVDENDNIDEGCVDVDIPPDEEALIKNAGGDNNCEHNWSSEGESGLDENPGVWSVGGTAMVIKDHCTICNLQRTWRLTGSQKNPGEHDTIEFFQPEEDDES